VITVVFIVSALTAIIFLISRWAGLSLAWAAAS
jgi:hypothetical protein